MISLERSLLHIFKMRVEVIDFSPFLKGSRLDSLLLLHLAGLGFQYLMIVQLKVFPQVFL